MIRRRYYESSLASVMSYLSESRGEYFHLCRELFFPPDAFVLLTQPQTRQEREGVLGSFTTAQGWRNSKHVREWRGFWGPSRRLRAANSRPGEVETRYNGASSCQQSFGHEGAFQRFAVCVCVRPCSSSTTYHKNSITPNTALDPLPQ